jgi:uncharacterized protein YraI
MWKPTLIRSLAIATAGALVAITGPAPTALAASGTVVTTVNIRSGPGTGYSVVGSQPAGSIQIDCQSFGDWVTGSLGKTMIWDHIPSKGYVSDGYVRTGSDSLVAPVCSVNPAIDRSLAWFAARIGSTAYQGYCEMAVENSYGTTGIWASAKANWNDAVARGAAHRGDLNPPRGALVFWDLAAPYGHVGVAKGDGTFYATSVRGAIGHALLPYFSSYLGWAWPNF